MDLINILKRGVKVLGIFPQICLFILFIFIGSYTIASGESKPSFVGQRLSELKKKQISSYGVNVDYLSSLYEPNLRIESLHMEPGNFVVVIVRLDKVKSGATADDGTVVAALDLSKEVFKVNSGPQVECNKSEKTKLVVGVGVDHMINEKKMSFRPKKAWVLDPKTMQFETVSAKSIICAPKDPNVVDGY